MVRVRMMLMFGLGFLLTGKAEAADETVPFTCKLPWDRASTQCREEKFSLRTKETVTITVDSVKDSDAKDIKEKCPDFLILDQNDKSRVLETLNICPGRSKSYKIPKNKKELIVKLNAKMEGWGDAVVDGSYKITQDKSPCLAQ
jgi:hypothetical protein